MNLALPCICCLTYSILATHTAYAAVVLASPSTEWTSLGPNFDFLQDQQTGPADSDIVGNADNPGFYSTFDPGDDLSTTDGFLAFRIRLDDAGGNNNNPQLDDNLWIGIDADLSGDIDVFLGVNTQGASSNIEIYGSGTGSNTSPSTTTIANTPFYSVGISSANYDYRPVDLATDGGTSDDLTPATSGDTDYYVSFQLEFAQLVAYLGSIGITIDEGSPLQYVVATSTQTNSLNQDLGGVDGNDPNYDPAVEWTDNGGFSAVVTAGGEIVPVPEPTPGLLLGLGLSVLIGTRRSRTG